MPDQDESRLGALAVERGWIEQAQLDEALANRRKMRDEMGIRQSVAQILLGKELLTKDQVKELARAVARETGDVRIVGGYEVIARLGSGGMGAVYKASKIDTGELVALKVLPPSLATEKLVARFKREAEITSRLESEHIVGCVEFGFDKKRKCHFCALEFIEGEDLGARLKRAGKLPEAEAVAIARAIAEALQHAHMNGLVHRDVKPANIMVTPEGKAKLLDLGLARPASKQDVRLTQSGTFVGSAYYASPEQARGEGDIDTRSDVYSLAATLYHMVTGSPPFEGEAMMTVLQNQIAETVPWPAEAAPELSQGVCAIIAKGMAKDPGERYETPGEFASDLDRLAGGTEPEALAAPPAKSTVARRPRAKVRAAASARRPAARRAGAEGPRRARDYGRGAGRPGSSKTPYAIAGAAVVALAVLGIIFAGGPKKKPRERPRPLPTVAVTPEPVAPPPAPPVVENEPPEPAEQLVPEVAPPAPTPITLPVPPVPTAGAAAARQARIARIPADAVEFAGHWYKGYEQGVIWRDAKAFCERQGGHLATITSKEENDFIAGLLPTKSSYYWIGFTDEEQEGRWEWVTGEPVTFKVWAEGEPNNAGGIENHAMLSPAGGTWIDKHEVPFFFVCEWEPGTKAVGAARGLVGHWKFDDGEGTVARDSSGKGNHGSVKGGAKWTKGKLGGALEFDGTGYIDIDSGVTELGNADFTVAAWLKTSAASAGILAKSDNDAKWERYEKQFYLSLSGNVKQGPVGSANLVGNDCEFVSGARAVNDGEWHLVAWTWERGVRGGRVYVDGEEATGKVGYSGHRDNAGDKVRIGYNASHQAPTGFVGFIDDVRIYDRALSAAEVKALFEGRGPPAEPEAPGMPTRLLAELDESLMKGDHAAARKWAEGVAGRAEYAEAAKEIASVEGVCRAMESRSKAALEGARARVGRKVELAGRLGKLRKGEVKAVTEKGIDLVTRFVIAAGGKRHEREKRVTVAWRELALDQVNELAREGGWKPAAADAAVARAYLALGGRKPKAAMKALERAADHPLAEHLLRKIADPSKPPEAAHAKRAAPPPTLTVDLGRGVKMELIYIKPGVFTMGGNENPKYVWQGVEKPKHEVAITRGFYMGKYEVTQAQYEAVMGANPSKWKEPNRPVEQVTWHEAVEFCRLAMERTGKQLRLPTEAEWEFACRAGSTGRYCFGNDEAGLDDYARYKSNSTHPVGQKTPNRWGLRDMHGNVWEWVADWYAADYYAKSPRENPTGPDTGARRLLRGGAWYVSGTDCRSALRYHSSPSHRGYHHGFRAVVSAAPGPAALSPRAKAAYERAMSRAKMRVRLKNWKGAAEACEEALKAKPGDAEAKKLLAEAESHIGPAPTLTLDLGNKVTMELVYIKPGVFIMGGTEGPKHAAQGVEKPKHEVAITRGFYIGKYEVTQSQYEAVMGGNPSKWKEPNRPVEQVTWHEAAEFCRLATERTPRHVRLPAEAEWEYACRAGSTGRYCFGSDETGLADYAWLRNNSGGQTHPVGERKPNAWGLHDMHGNVWEWVADRYDAGYYAKSPRENPAGPDSGRGRVVRGGAWANRGSGSRSAYRLWFAPSHRSTHFGFRVAVGSSVPRALSASQRAAYDRAMSRAKMRVRLKNWKGAVESLEEALKAKPGDVEAKRLLAEAKRYAGPAPTLTLDLGEGVTMEMVYIKPGVFTMGGTEDPRFPWQGVEKPKHEVAITRGFYVGRYEVTQAQYEAVTGANPSSWKEPGRPVEQMSWNDAVEFCRLARERTGKEVRLPTEAEWEYACRAGSTGKWCFGNHATRLGEYAWYKSNSGDRTHPVGQKKPNARGLHDMHGNVWEWVADRYAADYYAKSPRENPAGPAAGSHRVLRGAALCDSGRLCRTAIRCHLPASARSHVHGFRVVSPSRPSGPGARRGAAPASTAGTTTPTIKGRWYYEEFGNAYSREFTADGKCIFRKAGTLVWSVPYRLKEGKAIVTMPDGLVLVHELTPDGRLNIEGKFLASKKGRR